MQLLSALHQRPFLILHIEQENFALVQFCLVVMMQQKTKFMSEIGKANREINQNIDNNAEITKKINQQPVLYFIDSKIIQKTNFINWNA